MSGIADALDLAADGIESAFDAAGRYLLAVIWAFVVLVAARLALSYLRNVLNPLISRSNASPYAHAVVHQILTISVYFLALTVVLAIFGASWSGVLAFFTITSIAVALSIQDILKNLIAGLYILLERPFAPGETLRVKEVEGSVERISLRTTRLRAADDDQVIVPNAVLFSEIVLAPHRPSVERLAIDLNGLPGRPTEVGPAVRDALETVTGLRRPKPHVLFRRVSDAGSDVRVTLWRDPALDVIPEALERLHDRFPTCEIVVAED